MKNHNLFSLFGQLQYGLFIIFVMSYTTISAQVITKPNIHFPLNIENSSNGKKLTSTFSKVSNISAVLDVGESVIDHYNEDRHGRSSSSFFFDRANLDVPNARRLKIADLWGTNTSLSFFGINTNTGQDISELTISCWVYVDPSEDKKRYLFYAADANGKLGFGLSLIGENLYLIKYVNNATATKGAKITGTVVGNSWEGKLLGPATFNAGTGWYHVILVQAAHYTRLFVGMPPEQVNGVWQGKKGKYNKNFAGSMVMHGKQNLTTFTKWGIGVPVGSSNDGLLPVQKADDFMVFDYAMTEVQAQALYNCQVSNSVDVCFGAGLTYTQHFAIIGDYGCDGGTSTNPTLSNPEEKVAGMVKFWNPDFILTLGDDTYSASSQCNSDIDNNVGKYYEYYIYPYKGTYSDGNPDHINKFFPVMGNHDRDCPPNITLNQGQPHICNYLGTQKESYYKCSCFWEIYFPTEQYAPNNGRYYTFTKGNIQFFAVHSNKEEPDGNQYNSVQANWLKNALAASTATFKVVYMHHPPYASRIAGHGGNNAQDEMSKWSFKEWGADIVIAGDNHFYERNDYKNLTYIVNGVGGYPGLSTIGSNPKVAGNRVHIENEFGAVRVQSNDNAMYYQFYSIDPTDPNNRSKDRLRDEFWLYKRATGATYLVENPAELVRLQAEDEPLRQQALTVYPNPTSGELTLRVTEKAESNATIRVLDVAGKQVYTQLVTLSKGAQEISLSNLKAKGILEGVYFLQVVSPQRNSTVKMVIQ